MTFTYKSTTKNKNCTPLNFGTRAGEKNMHFSTNLDRHLIHLISYSNLKTKTFYTFQPLLLNLQQGSSNLVLEGRCPQNLAQILIKLAYLWFSRVLEDFDELAQVCLIRVGPKLCRTLALQGKIWGTLFYSHMAKKSYFNCFHWYNNKKVKFNLKPVLYSLNKKHNPCSLIHVQITLLNNLFLLYKKQNTAFTIRFWKMSLTLTKAAFYLINIKYFNIFLIYFNM